MSRPGTTGLVGRAAHKPSASPSPQDWILFYDDDFSAGPAEPDNTGLRRFLPRVFPAHDFPSDHAAVAVRLIPRPAPPQPLIC